jgi:multisubunit Na+/H+ antiporter MnhF subunit
MNDQAKLEESRLRNVGGTRGGMGEFLIGLACLVAGGYLFLNNVQVGSTFIDRWGFSGYNSFGLTLLPVFIGICFLFFNGKSIVGWVLTGGGLVVIFVGILARMNIWFRQTSLWNTLIMLALIAAGVGLIARSLREHKA